MTLEEAITRINYAVRGTDDDAPTFGSEEWDQWVNTLNAKKDELYADVKQRWSNIFEVRSVGTITVSATPSFDLDDDFLAPSNEAYVVTTGNQRINLDLVHPEEVSSQSRQVYISGGNPQTISFSNAIESGENIVGGALYVPAYYIPDDVASESDELPFLDPNWAVYSTAAEIAFSDITYEDKAADLSAKANNLYKLMVNRNNRGSYSNPRRTPTIVRRIRNARR